MYEGIIETLIKLFAIITEFRKKLTTENVAMVESYLRENFSSELVEKYITIYRKFIQYYHIEHREIFYNIEEPDKRFLNKKYLKGICDGIDDHFDLNARFLIISQLLNFINKEKGINSELLKIVNYVALRLKINPKEYEDLSRFALYSIQKVKDKSSLFLVNGNKESSDRDIKHLYRENQSVELELIRVNSTNSLFLKYWGPRNMYLNGHRLNQKKLYLFPPGGTLKTSRIIPIYYSSIMTRFIQGKGNQIIVYNAENIEYRFSKKIYGLHPFSFQERSGDMVGIIGDSGVGKTTLLNVLNGKLEPHAGHITINGYDLFDQKNKKELRGVIGYVPQDDLLIEELTVYENLSYNARLCFGNMDKNNIERIISQTLIDFDLIEARDLRVGNPLKKILSGGQRKRLNIALELMREPSVLFVDEPTSGLSSSDSEKVMYLLKRQCLKGKLVFANIHQPSSDLYKLFDRIIIMDKGGRIIFFGNPMDAITYFKHQADYVNPDESECITCGNVKVGQPLRIIASRMVDPFGKNIRKRKVSPDEWYQSYKEKVEPKVLDFMHLHPVHERKIPKAIFKSPKWFNQFKLFAARDLRTKKANRQYMAIALLEAPLLALILSFFSRFSNTSAYLFGENDNIPAFLFMSVVVALFVGMSISAEEIFKDRRIRTREEFLNLSKGAYFSAKIFILFTLSAIQIFSFVLIINLVLGISDLSFSTWLILFSTACFANILGLNLSAGMDSIVAIYIMIPLLLVPQLLLSGVVIDFNKMPNSLSSYDKTPVIGDIMVSRWSYEALAVDRAINNRYSREIFDNEKQKNNINFKTYYFIPEVSKYFKGYNRLLEEDKPKVALSLSELLKNSFYELLPVVKTSSDSVAEAITQIGTPLYNHNDELILSNYLDRSEKYYGEKYQKITAQINEKYKQLLDRFDGNNEKLLNYKNHYVNKKTEEFVRNKYAIDKIYISHDNHFRQKDEPIYRKTTLRNGRAHFYASEKYIGNLKIKTPIFNISVIWFFTFLLMATLYFDVLRKTITYRKRKKLTKQAELREDIFNNPKAFIKEEKEHKL